jgi:hypothetical protein
MGRNVAEWAAGGVALMWIEFEVMFFVVGKV